MLEKALLGGWNLIRGKIIWFLILTAILLGVFGYGATLVDIQSTIDGNIDKDSREYKALMALKENFSDDSLIVVVKGNDVDEILSDQNMVAMKYITDKGDEFEKILYTLSPEFFIRTLKDYGQVSADATPAEIVLDETGEITPQFKELMPNRQNAMVVIGLWQKISTEEVGALIDEWYDIIDDAGFDSNVEYFMAGAPITMDYMGRKTSETMNQLMGIGVIIMLLALAFFFRVRGKIFRRWIVLGLVAVSIVYTFGIMGFLDVPLTNMSMVTFPILLGLGVDYAVQFHNRYDEESRKGKTANECVESTLRRVGPPIVMAMLLCMIGLSSTFLVDNPQTHYFGTSLILGVGICMTVALSLLLGILYLLDKRHDDTRKSAPSGTGILERYMGWLLPKTVKFAIPIILVGILFSVLGWYYEDEIKPSTGYEGILREDLAEMENVRYLQELAGGVSPLDVVIEADNVLEPEILQWALDKSDELVEGWGTDVGGNVGAITSLAHVFEANFGGLPTTVDQAELYVGMMPKPMWINLVREDRTALHITLKNQSAENVDIQKTMDAMDEVFVDPPPGSIATVTGLSIVGPKSADLLNETRDTIEIYGIVFILIALLLMFKLNIKRVLAAAFPILLVLGWGALFMYISGINVSSLMALLPAQMIAIGIEFTILLLMRYYEERDKGEDPIAAMTTAMTRIGRAILVSGGMVVLGFGVLMLAFEFPFIQEFGLVTVIDMVLILTSTLIVLPALVVTFDKRKTKAKVAESTSSD